MRPGWFPQPCHLLPASPQSLPSPLHRRESRLPSEQVNHVPSLVQVEIICTKSWTQMGQAGKLPLTTDFQPVHPQCDNGASPILLAAAFQASMSEAFAETAQFSQRTFFRSVLCPCKCFCVQPCSCCVPVQAKVLAGDEFQSSSELCLSPFGLQGCDPTWTEISWDLQDLSCSASHPGMSFVNPIALY